MSFRALAHVFRTMPKLPPSITPTGRLVLLALANRHNQETGRCDPSLATLSADTGMSERAVRTGLRGLEKARVIQTVERRLRTGKGRRNMTNRYRITALKGGAESAATLGQILPPNLEDIPSAFDDLASLIDERWEDER